MGEHADEAVERAIWAVPDRRDPPRWVSVEVLKMDHETPKAYLLTTPFGTQWWPKSVCALKKKDSLRAPAWLVDKKRSEGSA